MSNILKRSDRRYISTALVRLDPALKVHCLNILLPKHNLWACSSTSSPQTMDLASPRAIHRAKPPPPPIRLPSSPSGSRSSTPVTSAVFSPQKLLYELPPSAGLRSPPPQPPTNRSFARSRSPPSASARRTSFGAALQSRSLDGQEVFSQVGSPKRHTASLGGNEPSQHDLDSFAEACRRWCAVSPITSHNVLTL